MEGFNENDFEELTGTSGRRKRKEVEKKSIK